MTDIGKEALADLLREFPTWGHAALHYKAESEKLERVLKRKAILDNYGITIENVKFPEWFEIVSSNSKLEEWFGSPLEKYILDEFIEAEVE